MFGKVLDVWCKHECLFAKCATHIMFTQCFGRCVLNRQVLTTLNLVLTRLSLVSLFSAQS